MTRKSSILSPKRLGWTAVAACVGCCTVPVVAVALGSTSIAGLGVYFEQAATGFFVTAVALFLYGIFRKRQRFCRTDCSCKSVSENNGP